MRCSAPLLAAVASGVATVATAQAPPSTLCAEAAKGGTQAQRFSIDPTDKEAVWETVCSPECLHPTNQLLGANARRIFCGAPKSTTNPGGGIWGLMAPKQTRTTNDHISQAGRFLYDSGGYAADRVTVPNVDRYDVASNEWTPVAKLPRPLNHAMPATVGETMYLIGGQESGDVYNRTYFNEVYSYDAGRDQWNTLAPLPTRRSAGYAAVVDEKIYVSGGRHHSVGADFAVYDVAVDEWTELPPMPQQRNHFVMAAVQGKMYAVGGRLDAGYGDPQVTVNEVYDPGTNTWRSDAAPMPPTSIGGDCCSGHNGIVVNDCLHIFGGENVVGVLPEHRVYNPHTDEWTPRSNMPVPVHGAVGMAFSNGWIHVVGGGTSRGGQDGQLIHQVYYAAEHCTPDGITYPSGSY